MSRYPDRFDVHGADFNRRMIEVARGNLRRSGTAASLICANVEALPYPDASFDSVVNTMAFSGYPDGVKALTEMKRVLRPGGRLILIDFCYPADGNRLGVWSAKFWKLSGDLIRDMDDLFRRCGLELSDEAIGAWGSVHLYIATRDVQ
jgi:ubiquinone/menaquinone biosynthesis C-methylase UbiE